MNIIKRIDTKNSMQNPLNPRSVAVGSSTRFAKMVRKRTSISKLTFPSYNHLSVPTLHMQTYFRAHGLRSTRILGPLVIRSRPLSSYEYNGSRSVYVRSHDTDEYEDDVDGYDSDDYEDFRQGVSSSRKSSIKSTEHKAPGGPPSVSYSAADTHELAFDSTSQEDKKSRQNPTRALSSGFNIFLLFGAAIDRFVSRAQAAGLAACAASLLVLKHLARVSLNHVNKAKLKVQHSFHKSPAGRRIDLLSQNIKEVQRELPDDTWGKIMWLWDRPPVQRLRLTVSMFNLSFRLPALMALVATQVGLLASQVSLPMLAPLLLGTGMLLRSIKTNASFLFPRIGLLVVMLWMLWFMNSVIQNTVAYLRKQGAIDNRLAGGIITVSEVSTLLVALVVLLSMLGVNVSALLLPAGIAVAIAAKDLSHNFLAGFFLFVVQPFKLGDRLAVSSAAPGVGSFGAPGSMPSANWFEGICEKVDLRYTVVRQGRRKLVIPNSAFLTREFMVVEDVASEPLMPPPPFTPSSTTPTTSGSGGNAVNGTTSGGGSAHVHNGVDEQQMHYVPFLTNDHRHIWQYVQGPPLHHELAAAYNPAILAQQAQQVQQQQQQQQQGVQQQQGEQQIEQGSVEQSTNDIISPPPPGAAATANEPLTSSSSSSSPTPVVHTPTNNATTNSNSGLTNNSNTLYNTDETTHPSPHTTTTPTTATTTNVYGQTTMYHPVSGGGYWTRSIPSPQQQQYYTSSSLPPPPPPQMYPMGGYPGSNGHGAPLQSHPLSIESMQNDHRSNNNE